MSRRLLLIPTGGGGSGSDIDPTQYYTRDQIDTMLADFVTESTNSLINYYLKTETYSQEEINSLISAIETTHFEVFASISEITDPQSNVLYLVGPVIETGDDRYEIYIYANNQFVKIDDTSVDLNNYVTTTDLQNAINTAMNTLTQYAVENFYQKSEVDEMIAQVQTLQGLQGLQGIAGQNGTNGIQGLQGIAGQNGTNGIQGIQGPAGGGGGANQWFGSQAQFDALENPSADVDYFISGKLDYNTDLKNTPDLSALATKSELNEEAVALDGKKENKIKYMTMEAFQSIQPQEGHVYAIEGNTVEMVFTFTDNTQATYNVVVD